MNASSTNEDALASAVQDLNSSVQPERAAAVPAAASANPVIVSPTTSANSALPKPGAPASSSAGMASTAPVSAAPATSQASPAAPATAPANAAGNFAARPQPATTPESSPISPSASAASKPVTSPTAAPATTPNEQVGISGKKVIQPLNDLAAPDPHNDLNALLAKEGMSSIDAAAAPTPPPAGVTAPYNTAAAPHQPGHVISPQNPDGSAVDPNTISL